MWAVYSSFFFERDRKIIGATQCQDGSLIFMPLEHRHEGYYTCVATSRATGKKSQSSTYLVVEGETFFFFPLPPWLLPRLYFFPLSPPLTSQDVTCVKCAIVAWWCWQDNGRMRVIDSSSVTTLLQQRNVFSLNVRFVFLKLGL